MELCAAAWVVLQSANVTQKQVRRISFKAFVLSASAKSSVPWSLSAAGQVCEQKHPLVPSGAIGMQGLFTINKDRMPPNFVCKSLGDQRSRLSHSHLPQTTNMT